MKFSASKMYCKYVIKCINSCIKKVNKLGKKDEKLEDELYRSYLKLEKLLKEENS